MFIIYCFDGYQLRAAINNLRVNSLTQTMPDSVSIAEFHTVYTTFWGFRCQQTVGFKYHSNQRVKLVKLLMLFDLQYLVIADITNVFKLQRVTFR